MRRCGRNDPARGHGGRGVPGHGGVGAGVGRADVRVLLRVRVALLQVWELVRVMRVLVRVFVMRVGVRVMRVLVRVWVV